MDNITVVSNSFNGTKESETEIIQHNQILMFWMFGRVGWLKSVINVKLHLKEECVLKRNSTKNDLQ